MNDSSEEDSCDRLLDQALAEYSRVEVPTGLESRILRRVHRPQRLRMTAQILGGLAALAASALLLTHHPEPQPVIQQQPQWSQLLVPARIPERYLQIGSVTPRRINVAKAKASIFPTPTPLTSEERALIAMAQNFPQETDHAFAASRNTTNEPIQIEALKITPFTIEGENR